jgi:hypothetical protein
MIRLNSAGSVLMIAEVGTALSASLLSVARGATSPIRHSSSTHSETLVIFGVTIPASRRETSSRASSSTFSDSSEPFRSLRIAAAEPWPILASSAAVKKTRACTGWRRS